MKFKDFEFESEEMKSEIKANISYILGMYGIEATEDNIGDYDIERIDKTYTPVPTKTYLKDSLLNIPDWGDYFDYGYTADYNNFDESSTALVKTEEPPKKAIMKPKDIVYELDKKVIGQDNAKKMLAIEVYKHLLKLENPESMKDVNKNNILFVGDSGTGKTFLCETICNILDLPFEIIDASGLSDTGYIGASITDFLERLYNRFDGDIEKIEKAIVVLDELDKLVDQPNANKNSNKDVASELLKVVEGSDISIKIGFSNVTINTSNMLFIGCGAFDGIENIVAERLKVGKEFKKHSIGFAVSPEVSVENKELSKDELRERIEKEDLIKYGLLRELIGRFPLMVSLNSLKEEDLIKILKNQNGGIVKEYKDIFTTLDKTLIVKEDTYKFISEKAIKDATGARALRGTFGKLMSEYMFNAPSEKKKRYVINREYCEKVLKG